MTRSDAGSGIIRFKSSFVRVLEVVIEHAYYSSGLCPDFSFRPISATMEALSQHGMQFRDTGTGFALLRDLTRKQFFWPGAETLSFEFEGKTTNPYWVNFTDIPLLSSLKLDFSNTFNSDLLHPGTLVDALTASEGENGGVSMNIKLDFQFEVLGLGNEEVSAPINYRIAFGARATRWRYFCYGKAQYLDHFKNFRIQSGKDRTDFEAPQPAALLNGTRGFEIVSSRALQLSERPVQRFSLQLEAAAGHSGYQCQLPNAGPAQVRSNAAEGQYYSDIIFQL